MNEHLTNATDENLTILQVNARLGSRMATVRPAVPLIRPLLSCPSISYGPGGPLGYFIFQSDTELYRFNPVTHSVTFSMGLWPRVEQTLLANGIEVTVQDHRKALAKAHVVHSVRTSLGESAKEIVESVLEHSCGQIEVEDDFDVNAVMELLTRTFRPARILVLVATRKAVKRWQRRLNRILDTKIGVYVANCHNLKPRCVVSTISGVPCQRGPSWDIVLFPYGHEVPTETVLFRIFGPCMAKARIYSLVKSTRRLSRRDELYMETISGPVIYSMAPETPKPTTKVLSLQAPTRALPRTKAKTKRTHAHLAPLDRKRQLYWHSGPWNQHLAHAAQVCLSGASDDLMDLGLTERMANKIAGRNGRQVTVLVESPEHARELTEQLGGTDADNSNLQVITLVRASQEGIDTDILIRGDGCAWPLRVGREDTLTRHPMLVIDYLDTADRQAERDAQARQKDYKQRGWTLVEGSPVQTESREAISGATGPHRSTAREMGR